jgi:phosphatidate cytidylyltransferase
MAPEDREGEFEDLFDDLDSFFEPGEDAPKGSTGQAAVPAEGTEPESRGPEAPGPEEEMGVRHEDEILPPGWREVGDLELGADTGEHPPIEPWQAAPESEPPTVEAEAADEPKPEAEDTSGQAPEQLLGEPTDGGPGEASHEAWRPEPTSEMTGDDWSRLRDVIGDEEGEGGEEGEEGELGLLTEEPLAGETLFGYEEEEGAGEEPALSIDDLRKAPPEYRDLPGAGEEEEEQDLVGVALGEMPGPEDQGEPFRSEPAMAEVEAAADQLAQEFGEAPPSFDSEPSRTAPPGLESDDDLLVDLHPPGPRTIKVDPERMTGPTWEEPSSRGFRVEPVATPFGDRNLAAAVTSAALLVAAALISLFLGRGWFAIVAGVVVLIGQAELYATIQRRGAQPATALGLVMGALVLGAAYFRGEQAMLFVLPLALMLSFLWFMAAPPKAREGALANIGATMLGLIYVPFLAGYVLIMLSVASGRALVLTVLGLTFLYDVAAFTVGSIWGRRPLAPSISPKKTLGGLGGASLVTLVASIIIVPSVHPLATWQRAVVLGLLIDVFAPLGDLAESAIKRDMGVKDMGSIMRGHGGVLDRIDSVLFVAPAVFYFIRVVF